ncbi:MAG: twin-arginine translocation signal domain-containing protein, partial [Pirellulaceae bacterium]|nr:twin-arginine translocation signal domain-containing protein [Pirellulaceae bacterium]
MKCTYYCGSAEHTLARRQFLGGVAAGAGAVVGGLGALASPSIAKQLKREQMRVVVVNMAGGLSQLESW